MMDTMGRIAVACGLFVLGGRPLHAQEGTSPREKAVAKLAADLPALLKAADADNDGALDKVEFRSLAPAVRKAGQETLGQLDPKIAEKKAAKSVKKHDKDKDGKLDHDERKAMTEAARLKAIRDFDWDGDGMLNEREKTAMGWAEEGRLDRLFRRIDADGSGKATKDEIAAALGRIAGIKVPVRKGR
jgi:Ca2+-binding EF-hand superfamily protein